MADEIYQFIVDKIVGYTSLVLFLICLLSSIYLYIEGNSNADKLYRINEIIGRYEPDDYQDFDDSLFQDPLVVDNYLCYETDGALAIGQYVKSTKNNNLDYSNFYQSINKVMKNEIQNN